MLKLDQQAGYSTHDKLGQQPEIIELPRQKMAVVHTIGAPDRVMHLVLPALYSSVYKLSRNLKRMGKDFRISHMRVRWPEVHPSTDPEQSPVPEEQRHGIWGLPIPEDTASLPQRVPHVEVEIETWEYGTVAQIIHKGPLSEEGPDVKRLEDFIAENGYEVAGGLEEEYLVGPEPEIQRTVVRYPVKMRKVTTALGPVNKHDLMLVGSGA